jgi:sialidase-1
MTSRIRVTSTGIVYRNPKPYLRSVVAYHPSLILGRDKASTELIVTLDVGEAVESLDYKTVLSRSADDGKTWNIEGPILQDPPAKTTHTVRTSRLSDGSLVGFGGLYHRRDLEAGLLNRENFGFVPTDLFIVRSSDQGHSWSSPEMINPPLASPAWEICHSVVELRSGRWLAPTSTWRGWNGENPSGEQAVALISDDRGHSWPMFGRIFDGRETKRCHLEVSVVELADGRILAVGWVRNVDTSTNFSSEYCVSRDQGETYSPPVLTGFEAQTCKLLALRDGLILCAYRRNDRPGLWATLVEIKSGKWNNLEEAPLWSGAESGMTGSAAEADKLSSLKFGYPSLKQLPDGEVLLVFWCQEDCVTNIRWIRIRVS